MLLQCLHPEILCIKMFHVKIGCVILSKCNKHVTLLQYSDTLYVLLHTHLKVCIILYMSVYLHYMQLDASEADFSSEPFPEVYRLEGSCSEVSHSRAYCACTLLAACSAVTMATSISRFHFVNLVQLTDRW